MMPDEARGQTESPLTLRVALQQDMPDFNTFNLASNSIWKAKVMQFTLEGLAGTEANMQPYPLLADSWDLDPYALTLTVHLRSGVTFHDGVQVTADDVVFTYLAVRSGTTYSAGLTYAFDLDNSGWLDIWEIESGVIKVDDYTVKMMLAQPYGQFIAEVLTIPIIPMHIWQYHLSYDGIVDVLWNDPTATIGTGPLLYVDGIADTFRLLQRYDGYWGQSFLTPAGHRTYPQSIDAIRFVVTPTVDAAVQSLQAGALDIVPWAIPSNYLQMLSEDANIDLESMPDNGYFYLAFNEKLDPFGSLTFRSAVSHLIDKAQIVDVYMGGLGIEGSSCLPPFWGEWFNSETEMYPYDPTLVTSAAILDSAGFVDADGDGWRELPDGSDMEPIIILTPPADYDPVRIRAGLMIADNMRQVGIEAEAIAIDFDTLVSRLQSMDYQMLIIGWSLSSDPVGNLFDIIGPMASSNTFGFWSLANPNPFYFELMGVNTLADAETQALADQVLDLEWLAKGTLDTAQQMQYTKEAQSVIASAVPVNVLYYRTNVEAYRNAWSGWVGLSGSLLNVLSIGELTNSAWDVGFKEATSAVNAGLSMPGKVAVGGAASGNVLVINQMGNPVPGADVMISVQPIGLDTPSVEAIPMAGTTDEFGAFSFTMTGLVPGYAMITASASMGGVTSTDQWMIETVSVPAPEALYVSITPDSGVLRPGESTTLMIAVADGLGLPVEGAVVELDMNLLGHGSVDASWVVTDAGGASAITYYAPASIQSLNAHETDTLVFSIEKEGFVYENKATVNILTINEQPPQWALVSINSVSTTALTLENPTTSISVLVTDAAGSPLAFEPLDVEYSDVGLVTDPVASLLTDLQGAAVFDVTITDMAPTGALRVKVSDASSVDSVSATVTLTYLGTYPSDSPMYGGFMVFPYGPQLMGPLGVLDVTVYVWDEYGVPADALDASLIVSGTPFGSTASSDLVYWDSTWDGWGINIMTQADRQNIVTSGPFNTPYDYYDWMMAYDSGMVYWDWGVMTGVPIYGGALSFTVYGQSVAVADLIGRLFLVPGGWGTFSWDKMIYEVTGQTLISGEYVLQRSYQAVVATFAIDDPVLQAEPEDYESTSIHVWVKDQDGVPVEGADVLVYQNVLRGNLDYVILPSTSPSNMTSAPVPTDADGYAQVTLVAVGRRATPITADIVPDVYVRANQFGAVSLIAQTNVMIFLKQCFVEVDPILASNAIGSQIQVATTVRNVSGAPMPGMAVSLRVGAGDVLAPEAVTDEFGRALFVVETSAMDPEIAGFIVTYASVAGPTFDVATARAMIAVQPFAGLPPITVAKLQKNSLTTWEFTAGADGDWSASIDNNGLRKLDLVVFDTTSGMLLPVFHDKVKFAAEKAYPTGTVDIGPIPMLAGHTYLFIAIPNGPIGASATINPAFAAG